MSGRKWAYLADSIARSFGLVFLIDTKNKTWRLSSEPMFDPSYQVRYYDDILAIFQSDPRTFESEETRDEQGRLLRFSVST